MFERERESGGRERKREAVLPHEKETKQEESRFREKLALRMSPAAPSPELEEITEFTATKN